MTEEAENQEVDPRQVEAFEPLPGDLLVGARRARGISTAKAASALNLDESVVLALEENRFEDLGAPVFARGHLRKYARHLGLNPDDVIRAYDAVATEQSAAALKVSPSVARPVSADSGSSRRWLVRLLALVALAAVAVLAWRILQNGHLPLAPGPSAVTTEAPALLPDVGSAVGDVPEPEPAEPVMASADEASPGEGQGAASSDPGGSPAAPGQPQPGGLQPAQASAESPASTPPAPEPVADTPPARNAAAPPGALVMEFEQDSWLEVRDANGRRLAYELGRRGTRRTITGEAPFNVSLGFWPGVSLTYDGQPVAIPESARQGNTARFSVPAAADR